MDQKSWADYYITITSQMMREVVPCYGLLRRSEHPSLTETTVCKGTKPPAAAVIPSMYPPKEFV